MKDDKKGMKVLRSFEDAGRIHDEMKAVMDESRSKLLDICRKHSVIPLAIADMYLVEVRAFIQLFTVDYASIVKNVDKDVLLKKIDNLIKEKHDDTQERHYIG
jgi:hypothetical protein